MSKYCALPAATKCTEAEEMEGESMRAYALRTPMLACEPRDAWIGVSQTY